MIEKPPGFSSGAEDLIPLGPTTPTAQSVESFTKRAQSLLQVAQQKNTEKHLSKDMLGENVHKGYIKSDYGIGKDSPKPSDFSLSREGGQFVGGKSAYESLGAGCFCGNIPVFLQWQLQAPKNVAGAQWQRIQQLSEQVPVVRETLEAVINATASFSLNAGNRPKPGG